MGIYRTLKDKNSTKMQQTRIRLTSGWIFIFLSLFLFSEDQWRNSVYYLLFIEDLRHEHKTLMLLPIVYLLVAFVHAAGFFVSNIFIYYLERQPIY
jgi:hypothetical protein